MPSATQPARREGEEHAQQQGEQDQPLQRVAPEQRRAVAELAGVVTPERQGRAVGQVGVGQIGVHRVGHLQHVLAPHAVDVESRRGPTVQPGRQGIAGKAVLDAGHVPQPQQITLPAWRITRSR